MVVYSSRELVKKTANGPAMAKTTAKSSIERAQRGITIDYPLRWEIAQLFPEEFELGHKALAWVAERTGWQLPDDEAALMAMHFVSARFNGHSAASTFPHVLTEILETVENGIGHPLDRESIDVARFITHLRYLLVRLTQDQLVDGPFAHLGDAMEREIPDAFATARLVSGVLAMEYRDLSSNEIVYLALHIERLRRATNKNLP